jgi:hypothetical protein
MRTGQDQRLIEADAWAQADDWMVFYRRPAQGGRVEYWRVRLADVVSMETKA